MPKSKQATHRGSRKQVDARRGVRVSEAKQKKRSREEKKPTNIEDEMMMCQAIFLDTI